MIFRISDTFTDSLARLTNDEQKAVKTTVFDLQLNPASPGLSFHRLDRAKDKNFWSVRVGGDIRLIVHRTPESLLICYVGHHDEAYAWAERRKLQTHPKTGAAQLIELRETVQEVATRLHRPSNPAKAPLFAALPDDDLLKYGIPAEWLADVRSATEDTLLDLVDHLPGEASEALLELATGGVPRTRQATKPGNSPFDHPDAMRRFRVMADVEELERALEFPWEKWTVFLHPEQREWVERDYGGPARVSGSAGTGKTIVALHRAAHLARSNPDSRVLLATFTTPLASALDTKLRRLLSNEPRLAERIDVHSLESLALRLFKSRLGPAKLADRPTVAGILRDASGNVAGHGFSDAFILAEWEHLVDAWQLDTWEAYRDVARLGRKTRLPETRRRTLWSIFEAAIGDLKARNLTTKSRIFTSLAEAIAAERHPPFDFAVVDEAQDLSIPQLKFFAALGGDRSNALFFAGDVGQRIFQQPFSWRSLGVDIRGRSRTLRVNYRTSHQIRTQADRLLGPEVSDADGNVEKRTDTVSVFNGPPPDIHVLVDESSEIGKVGDWIGEQTADGVLPHEIGLFVRSPAQHDRAIAAAKAAGVAFKILDDHVETMSGHLSISTMHLAKGLEFRAVAVMACDGEIVPLQERIEAVGDDADLQEVYNTERQLLYVACTRARDNLLVTGVEPASEFLDDIRV